MIDLPRLKPVPIPAIHPVQEYVASGERARVYARTKAGFGVPWMGVVAMAFAHYPRFYEGLWSALEPVAGGEAFRLACQRLRDFAETEADALRPPSILPQLIGLGYDAREIDEIRTCNEIFSAGNMPYLLIASLARLLLEGHEWRGQAGSDTRWSGPPPHPKPPLIEAHHADPSIAALYDDVRETFGLPFVNTDYRAFARWPSDFTQAWDALKPAIPTEAYAAHTAQIHMQAVALARDLPNVTGLTSADLRAAADKDAPAGEVLDVVRLFQWLLPGLALNVAFFRAQLHGGGDS